MPIRGVLSACTAPTRRRAAGGAMRVVVVLNRSGGRLAHGRITAPCSS
jgi:hypothetical protein